MACEVRFHCRDLEKVLVMCLIHNSVVQTVRTETPAVSRKTHVLHKHTLSRLG